MSRLIDKQHMHSLRLAKLIIYADSLGYQISGGDWTVGEDDKVHRPNSLHRLRLATDINLFRHGTYLMDTESHRPLGEYWETMGGAWGGNFKNNPDGNHYSTPSKGFK